MIDYQAELHLDVLYVNHFHCMHPESLSNRSFSLLEPWIKNFSLDTDWEQEPKMYLDLLHQILTKEASVNPGRVRSWQLAEEISGSDQ